jgi:hypothetical protein
MKVFIKYITLSLLAMLVACSKDSGNTGDDYTDDFKFYFNANIDGDVVIYNAGNEDYALNTNYLLDGDNNVLSMSGMLSTADSSHKNAIMLRFRSHETIASEADFVLNQSIKSGAVALRDASGFKKIPGEYTLNLFPNVVSSDFNYFWNFEDSTSSSIISPSLQISEEQHPIFRVSLSADPQSGGCESKSTHFINIEHDCDATIVLSTTHGSGLEARAVGRNGNVIESVEWFREDVNIGSGSTLTNLSFNGDGNYKITAKVLLDGGCEKVIEKDLSVLSGAISFCDMDFYYDKQSNLEFDPLQLGTIEMVYYNPDGKLFTSYYENSLGKFKIHAFNRFEDNANGQKTTRFLFEGDNIELRSVDGETLTIRNAFGNFAIAHP